MKVNNYTRLIKKKSKQIIDQKNRYNYNEVKSRNILLKLNCIYLIKYNLTIDKKVSKI